MARGKTFQEEIPKMWDDAYETASADGLGGEELDHVVYTLLARRIVERLQQPNVDVGWAQAALRFCKDNDITGIVVPGSPQAELKQAMARRLPFKYTGTED